MLPHQQPTLSSLSTPEDEDPLSSTTSDQQGSSWWGSWQQALIDTVKQTSMQAVEMVKKDFNDFVETSVVLSDAAVTNTEISRDINPTKDDAAADAAVVDAEDGAGDKESLMLGGLNMDAIGSATHVVKEGMFNFLQSVSELIAIPPDSVSETGDIDNTAEKNVELDINTYLETPGGKYDDWVKGFDIHTHQHRMANVLIQSSGVGEVYAQLVPAKLSHELFWQRYFYDEFLNKEKREEKEEELKWEEEEEELKWDDEEEVKDEKNVKGVFNNELEGKIMESAKEEEEEEEEERVSVQKAKIVKGRKEGKPTVDRLEVEQAEEQGKTLEDKVDGRKEVVGQENLQEEHSITRRRSLTPTPPDSGDDIATPTVSDDEEDSPGEKTVAKRHSPNSSDTSSVGSWLSIDDVIKVKRVDGEQQVPATTHTPANDNDDSTISDQTDSASLLSDVSDEEFDLDVDEAEIAKMVEEIKMKKPHPVNPEGDDEDDDWEKWE